ncbi:hypothetical protein [Pseudooceanicola albus]|uniref:hypothetical protein n=2 Tax=Pseudooceanicola TaxID=1679449 RepID=UPI001F244293|nr:hypothetical protein [Pseudooceanicola albus]
MEYLEIRKANMALMAMTSALADSPTFHSEVLYEDRILWAVPKSVDPTLVRSIINGATPSVVQPPALSNRVVVDAPHEWRATSDIWFAAHLPGAVPFYVSDLHLGATEIVAAGLGTCHVSFTLHSNLSERIRSQVNFYDIGRPAQQMVLATPRHLMTVPAYGKYFSRLTRVLRTHYSQHLADHLSEQ